MSWRTFAAVAVVLAGCKKAPASRSEEEPRKEEAPAAKVVAVDAAPAVAVADATPADCSAVGKYASDLERAFVAMEPWGIYDRAREALSNAAAACRDAAFYIDVAILLMPEHPPALTIDGVAFGSRGQALAEAVKQPLDLFALRWIAFYGAIDHEVALPGDACAIADAEIAAGTPQFQSAFQNRADYVCGHAALLAGDGAAATKRFDAMTEGHGYADYDLRRAQAALLTGDRKAAAKLAKQAKALDSQAAGRGRAYEYDRKAIVAEAKRVLDEANRKDP